VLLLTDLAEYQLENIDKDEPPFFNDKDLLKSVVDLTASSDLDLQEKVIVDIKFKSNIVFCSAVLLMTLCVANLIGSTLM
jgi:nucleotide exchange factor SIL1